MTQIMMKNKPKFLPIDVMLETLILQLKWKID